MKSTRNIGEEYERIPCCPMLLRWPQTWIDGHPATLQSDYIRNFSKDAWRQPRSRCAHSVYRKSRAQSPVRRVTHVRSFSPTSGSTLSPPLSSSPLRYSDPLLKRRSRNDLSLDVMDATGQEIAAYFSPHPPSEPMHLITTPSHGHITTGKITATTSLESCSSSKKMTSNKKTLCEQKTLIIIAERPKSHKAQKLVRRLLRLLLQKLPLPVSSDEYSSHMMPACGDTMLLLGSETEYRSVSVQAFTVSTAVSVGDSSEIKYRDSEKDEMDRKKKLNYQQWRGGIRALRESHLRLVMRQLRQLRNIERLGRSLKRYT